MRNLLNSLVIGLLFFSFVFSATAQNTVSKIKDVKSIFIDTDNILMQQSSVDESKKNYQNCIMSEGEKNDVKFRFIDVLEEALKKEGFEVVSLTQADGILRGKIWLEKECSENPFASLLKTPNYRITPKLSIYAQNDAKIWSTPKWQSDKTPTIFDKDKKNAPIDFKAQWLAKNIRKAQEKDK